MSWSTQKGRHANPHVAVTVNMHGEVSMISVDTIPTVTTGMLNTRA